MSQEKIAIILTGSSNYFEWMNHIWAEFSKEKIINYLYTDGIKDIDTKNLKEGEDEKLAQNGTAKSIIIHSISRKIHSEVVGMESAFLMLKKIQRNYGGGENDTTYWMMKLNSLKTSNEKEITNFLEEMSNIFNTLEKADCKLSNIEKLKYLYNALPGEYMKKYILKDSTKYEELNKEIQEDIKNRLYNRRDNPMEIDFVNRGSNSKKHYTKDKMDQHKKQKILCHL
ncbi:hypothetical protein BCR36DRAFT_460401 [Piromyces finnis]|uniref:Uncharacterized protein n=1 Tax=Piromyces finnis TaxID=1754191 RepID=A0A1Y1UYH5_9FUNG|nr:hypothetical protein BCR36DRAFT_460401 [Piromyces finnis]|eukprot:ORX43519.1 hypothetical protein BCR36DRAFT_460401 [Piromyces finnis]